MTPKEFENLTNVYRSWLVRSAVNKWGDDGEDYVQEALLRAYIDCDKFDYTCMFSTWIYGYIKNVANDAIKKSLPTDEDVDVFDLSHHNTPESVASYAELLHHISDLSTQKRRAVVDRVQGKSNTENRQNLYLAKKHLRKLLGEDDED